MKTAAWIGRRAGGLIVIALALSTCGCLATGSSRSQTWQFQRVVEEAARSTQRGRSSVARPTTPQVKPSAPQQKTTETTNDSDERHPSRWKRKLKAAYA